MSRKKNSMLNDSISRAELNAFDKNFDTVQEDKAASTRGEFLQTFPLNKLKDITLDEYAMRKDTVSFCTWVEPKTKAWASMQGSTALKFGIYYGKATYDTSKKYRFTQKFGKNAKEAFNAVKDALLKLVKAGALKNFKEIDENPLSPMFKAKILSLYFPNIYLNICSADHIEELADVMGVPEKEFVSERQHLLFRKKLTNKITKNWSNPKFMFFLYAKFMDDDSGVLSSNAITKPRKKIRRKVNFEEVAANRNKIGKISEEFAVKWEKNRLIGLGYPELANKVEDRRDRPGYGYDYLSYSAPKCKRYIEVKSVGKDRKEGCFRFYLSENELEVSNSAECSDDYYFYLVFFNKDGKPSDLLAKRAKEFYSNSESIPCSYIVRFDKKDQ